MVRRPLVHDASTARDGDARTRRVRKAEGSAAADAAIGAAPGVRRFLIALALLGTLQVVVMLGVEAHRAVEGQRAIARLQDDIAELQAEAAGLEAIIEHGSDPVYREQLARRRGFVYPDEVRVVPLR